MDARDRLIVALDVPTIADAEAMVTKLGDSVSFYKIGYQLAFAGGLSLAQELVRDKKQVFIDLKLHDIGVAHGCRSPSSRVHRLVPVAAEHLEADLDGGDHRGRCLRPRIEHVQRRRVHRHRDGRIGRRSPATR